MFILHSSNKTENLVEHLASVMTNAPLSSPFAQEIFLIQSQGMERWLSQQLASRFNVWANYQFMFPWKFFAYIAEQVDSRINNAAFDRNQLLWRFELLLRHLDNDIYLQLRNYLSGRNQALKRFQLAKHLAQIFDQYQIMRPDLLGDWEKGKLRYGEDTEHWQSALWQQIGLKIGQPHRGALWLEVISKLNNSTEGAFGENLPERVTVFGINTMPPLFLDYLQSLSKHSEIHLYLLNPAQTYWADLANKRHHPIDNLSDGHPLLISLGQQGREFQDMLLDFTHFDFEPESFELIKQPNNLQQLQNDILDNRISGQALTKDNSISLHACHSRKREVEVLKDQLLFALENDPTLELRDIVVMAPDIQNYEPFISAVFHNIQHAIADRNLRQDNQALDAFIRFIELSQSRLGWQSVLDLLQRDDVYPAFGLSETDLELINFWVQDTNVRWGQSGRHKQELNLPPLDENTWQAALDRLFMGYAVGNDNDFVLGILPYINIEGSSAAALGGLNDFLHLLFKAKTEFNQAKTIKAWSLQLTYYAEQLLSTADFIERQQINELLVELSANIAEFHQEAVDLQVIVQWLTGTIAERLSVNGFLRGQLTFCSMIPMRAIPFKVIALLGINDGEFPKIDRKPTFDLITQHFRNGDRSRRADDRYQFLEILLSARQQLIISYLGQSQNNNETIPPSVLITELLDVLKDFYQLEGLTTKHPLQAFSSHYFDSTSGLFSFSQSDCDIAQALTAPKPEPVLWWQGCLDTEAEEIIELSDLFSFYQHPQRYFIRRQLNIQLTGIKEEVEERERFALNTLEAYCFHQEWVQALLTEGDISLPKVQAQGKWLPGSAGELEFENHKTAVSAFVDRIKYIQKGESIANMSVDLSIGNYRVIGKLGNCYQNGGLLYRFAKLKGKDFINAWLHHLLINQLQPQTTHLLTAEDTFLFQPDDYQTAYLPMFIDIYQKGKEQPNAFFTEVAVAYSRQAAELKFNPKARKQPIDAARDCLMAQINTDAEINKLYGNLADPEALLTDELIQHCENLILPAWEAAHEH